MGGVAGKFVKVLLATGKRKTALSEMKWEQIKLRDDGWFWDAPPGRKNKRLHPVPLSDLVKRILHPKQESGFVFAGHNDRPITVGTSPAQALIKAGANQNFFLHGCRHIAETKLAELKIPADIRDRLFDHAEERGSGKGYDHHEYADEMRAAIEAWANYIEKLVTPSGVTRIHG